MREEDLKPKDTVLLIAINDVLEAPRSGLHRFWTAVSANTWQALGRLVTSLVSPDRLAARFEQIAHSAPSCRHYRESVVESARTWREVGGRVVLVSPKQSDAAQAIAAHLGIYDWVQSGVDDATQDEKLRKLFGAAAWSWLAPANIEPRTGEVEATQPARSVDPRDDETRQRMIWKAALRLIRPHQWLKNTLVFLPMLAAHQLSLEAP